jgi:MFS family permease
MNEPDRLPRGIWNAHWFQMFNTMSFAIVLGMPMILWFKDAGATATMLGVVAALNPLLNMLQIPAARFLDAIGYRRFVLRGWAARSCFIVGMGLMALVPGSVGAGWRMIGMLLFLVAFNAARGVSACGFLPWMTQLVPASVRGRFLSRDQTAGALAMLATMVFSATYLDTIKAHWNFAVLFWWSYLMALASLWFLRRIPDVPVPVEARSKGRVPWGAMLKFEPFQRLLVFNVVLCIAFAGSSVFWVPLVRDQFGASNGTVLRMMVVWSGALAATLVLSGRVVDRVGSRPLLGIALGIWTVHFLGWAGLAAGVIPFTWPTVYFIQGTAGLASGLFNPANARLLMGTVPEMGRSHFFAMFSVTTSVIQGTLPVVWGMTLDRIGSWRAAWGCWEWNRYSVMYVVLAEIMIVALYFRHHVPEPRAMGTDEFLKELLVKTPSRALSRWVLRRPLP